MFTMPPRMMPLCLLFALAWVPTLAFGGEAPGPGDWYCTLFPRMCA